MLTGLIAFACLAPRPLNILFLGNSHTGSNDIPTLVKSLLESDGTGRRVQTKTMLGGLLRDLANRNDVAQEIRSGRWDVVVLQGAEISSSHRYTYPQDGPIALAKLAKQAKARALLFAEWPRKGWDESEYILDVYRKIAHASGAEIVHVCRSWDVALKTRPNLDLWLSDGNHSTLTGGYMAASAFYYFLSEDPKADASWRPAALDASLAKFLRESAKKAIRS